MDSKEIIEMLNQEPEMNPDAHDGSYELMREIIKSYSAMDDYSTIDYKDLNAVYAMAIGTWKLNVEKKKEYVFSGHLPQSEKDKMRSVIDKIWNNACIRKYENRENQEKPSIGMFGTGFYSFERNADQRSSQEFIKMMVDISVLDDDNQIYDRAGQVLNSDFKGMQAAAASVMLHCLKPYTFPILNSNFGDGTVYKQLGIKLESPGKLSTYIDNCRKIKTFRDENLTIKNYRILDRFPRKYNLTTASEYFPSLDEYDPEISADQYVELIQDSSIVNRNCLDTLYFMYLMGGEATCTEIANKYGDTAQHYSAHGTTIAKAVQSATNC